MGLWEAYNSLAGWMVSYVDSEWAVLALFIFAFAASSFFPIPPDILLMAMCVTDTSLSSPALAFFYAAACAVGSVGGGALGYAIGLRGGRPLVLWLFGEDKVLPVERAFQRYDVWAVGAAGFTPIPYKVFTISAGVFRLNFPRFLLASAVSRAGRFFLVAGVLAVWGRPVRTFVEANFGWLSILFFVFLFGGFFVAKKLAARASARGGDAR